MREKRLWPVAVALLAATAAVPLVLLKPSQSPTDSAPAIASNSGAEGLPVVNLAKGTADASKLNEFSQHNPFKPMGQLKTDTQGGSSSSSGSGSSSSGGSGGGAGGAGASGGSGGSGGSAGGAIGGTPSGGSGGGTVSTSQKFYAFRVNVRFGSRGHEKSYKDVKQLGMLPDDKSPVVVFMGMSSDFKTAIFLVDTSKYEAAGEGKCRPSPETCSFVELNLHDAGNEETIASPDGSSEYTLKLTGITRVQLSADQAQGDAKDQGPAPKGKAKAARATGGKAHGQDAANPLDQLFELPSFAVQG